MAVLFQLIDGVVCSSFVCVLGKVWILSVLDVCLEVQSFHKPVLVFNALWAENNYQSLLFKAPAVMFCGMKTNKLIFHGISDVSPSGDVRLIFSALVDLAFIS